MSDAGGNGDTLERVARIDEICDRFERELLAGRPASAAEFLRAAGIDPDAADPDLARELARVGAAYRTGRASTVSNAGEAPPARSFPGDERPGSQVSDTFPVVPGYEILGELGRGGMGVVYKARQVKAARVVALKVVRSGEHASLAEYTRFKTEAGAVARLQHPNVVQVFEVGDHAGLPFFSMEFVDGGNLAEKLAGNPIPPRDAAELVEKLALGVQAAHDRNVIHRDLKPANVLLGVAGQPKLTDFGLAKLTDARDGDTGTGAVLGTASYMAPEQAAGNPRQVGPVTDVYALGAILYECLTGRPPFKGASVADTLIQVKTQNPVPVRDLVPAVPRDLETICHKCLEKESTRRYATAALLGNDLRAFLEHRPIRARPIGRLGLMRRWARRNPAAAMLVVVVVVALGAAVGVGIDKSRSYQEAVRLAEWNRYQRNVRDAGEALARGRYDEAEGFLHDCPEYLRNAEWHVLRSACRPNLKHRLAHGSHVCGVAADLADGKRIATAGMDGRVILWDAESGLQLGILKTFPKRVTNLASGAKGRYLAAAWDEGMCVWDLSAGSPRLVTEKAIGGWVAMAQDTEHVAVGSDDGRLRVWNLSGPKAGDPVFDSRYPGVIYCLAISPDGTQLAVGGMRKGAANAAERSQRLSLRLWDVSDPQPLEHLRPDYWIGFVFGLAWGVADRRLVSVSNQIGVVWDSIAGGTGATLPNYETAPKALAFDRTGRHLAASFSSGAVKVWEFQPTPHLVFARKPDPDEGNPGFDCVSFDPNGEFLAYSQGSDVFVERWKSHGGVRLLPGTCLAYSPDGRRAATGSSDGSVRLRDAADGSELDSTGRESSPPAALAFSPDGDRVAVARDKAVWIWKPGSGPEVKSHAHAGKVLCVAYSPAGGLLASSDDLGHIHVRDTRTGALHKLQQLVGGPVPSLAFSPDGRHLAAGDLDWRVNLWDTRTWESANLEGHGLGVTSVAFSPDGRWLASSSSDQTVRLWEVNPVREKQSRAPQAILRHGVGVVGVAFSADRGRGGRVVSLGHDGVVRFWAIKAGADRGTRGVPTPERHRELLHLAPWQKGGGPIPGRRLALRPDPTHWQAAVTFDDGRIEIREGGAN